jgi:RND superfamily putative drug exporter
MERLDDLRSGDRLVQSGQRSWLRRTAAVISSGLGRGYRFTVTTLRWVVVLGWVAGAIALTVLVPYRPDTTGSNFGDLLPADSQVFKVERRILEEFRVPLLSGTTVVVHEPGGMNLLTRADSLLWALATTQDTLQAGSAPKPDTIAAAIPVPTGRSDVTVTYLYVAPGTGLHDEVQLADRYAAHFKNQPDVSSYVTGFVPAQIAQLGYLDARLRLFEFASVLVIVAVVALAFRSLLAPVVVVGVAVVGYLVYFPLLSSLAAVFGFTVPAQLEPVLVALLLGVVTDYCVLFFSAFRDELRGGLDRKEAARAALQVNAPIITVAGLTVAGGTIALLAAPFHVFRGLGPALALTVLVGLAVCLTLAPAVMTILGWRLFTVLPVRGSQARNGFLRAAPRRKHRLLALLIRRPTALLVAVAVGGGLAIAAVPLTHARLDLSFVAALPRDDSVAEGADLLALAGLRGISAPTEILVEKPGVVTERAALARLQSALAQQPGVARVIGPAELPTKQPRGLLLSESGNAARYLLIYDSDPLGAQSIGYVRQLEENLPDVVARSGLSDAEVSVAGQTLFAATVAQLTRRSIEVTVLVALVIELVILVLYLRALVAPVVLLAASALSVAAALGLTTFLFQDVLGQQGLTFYAPFAAAVLLIALGADYTVFSVGSIWEAASRKPLQEAIMDALPRTSRAITTAGVILAATFALVAIIPLATFRQIAFAVTVGLMIDTLIVRPVLTPALLTLLGRRASWPSKRITQGERHPLTSARESADG